MKKDKEFMRERVLSSKAQNMHIISSDNISIALSAAILTFCEVVRKLANLKKCRKFITSKMLQIKSQHLT